jgi:hypothetical protein
MQSLEELRTLAARAAAKAEAGKVHVYLAGATAEMSDIRRVTRADFLRVAGLALGVILLVIIALLRDPLLAVFMIAATVMSYLATLGVSAWVFAALGQGLDWKVRVFLFVVMVAVGGDYSLFLATHGAGGRLLWPARGGRTGPRSHRAGHLLLRPHHGRHARQPAGRRTGPAQATGVRLHRKNRQILALAAVRKTRRHGDAETRRSRDTETRTICCASSVRDYVGL